MQSRQLLNLILLLFAVVLAFFIYSSGNQQADNALLTSLTPEKINSISIIRNKSRIDLSKVDNKWIMQTPYTLRAHDFRIQRLLDIVRMPVIKTYDMEDLNLADYGLQPVTTSIQFNKTLIHYGDINRVNGMRYLQLEESLHLVNDQLYPLLNAQATSFIDLSLFSTDERIHQIVLPEFTLSQTNNGQWQIDKDEVIDADSLQSFIENWQNAQAFAVHAYLPRKQLGKITIQFKNNTNITLEITDNDPWLILGRPEIDIEYHFDKQFVDKLLNITGATDSDNNDA